MRYTWLFIGILAIIAAYSSAHAEDAGAKIQPVAHDAIMTPEQVRADIKLAEEAFSRVHPGYTRYASAAEMQQGWAGIIDRAEREGGLSLPDFYLASEMVLTRIRCDHTKAELPRSIRAARTGQPVYLPLRWQWIEDRGIIRDIGEGVDAQFGDEILEIDGRPLADLVAEISPYIPVDGYTEWSRNSGISESLEFMGGGVDHFGALLWDISPEAVLKLRSADGAIKTVKMPRITFKQWSALGAAGAASFKDAVMFERIGSNVGYLRIDTFVNYRETVKPQDLYEPVFKALREEGRKALILDLRRNGGGSVDASLGLLANLIGGELKPVKAMIAKTLEFDGIRQHLSTWDPRALKPNPMGFSKTDDGRYSLRSFVSDDLATLNPTLHAFQGDLFVLTSNNNSSGSTNLIAVLKDGNNVVTVGERTGGSAEGPTAGLQFTLTLPHSGVRMRLPFFHVKNNVSAFENGLGIAPDYVAPMTVDAFREGRDPALKKALELANSSA